MSVGVTEPGMVWAVPESSTGGSTNQQTFLLIAPGEPRPAEVAVTLTFDDGTTASKTFPVAAETRLTVDVAAEFPASDGRTFNIIVESLGAGAPIVVECTRYATPGGSLLDEGESAPATRIR